MPKNEKTGKEVAKIAGQVLKGVFDNDNESPRYQKLLLAAYALAGSALTQSPDKPTKVKNKRV